MNEWGVGVVWHERRSARRFEARHVALLQFVTPLSGLRGVDGAKLRPIIICQTQDISESVMALLVPALREGDENFCGVKAPVLVTLVLPSGVVRVRAVTERLARGEPGVPGGGFLVCVKLTGMDSAVIAQLWKSE